MPEKEEADLGAKCRLFLDDKDLLLKGSEDDQNGIVAMVTSETITPEISVGNDGINARSKKAGDDSTSLGSAGSHEGSVWS